MAINESGIVYLVLYGLASYVFGNMVVTCTLILFGLLLVSWLIRIPLPISAGLNVPITIVMLAHKLIPTAYGGLLIVLFVLMASSGILKALDII